MSAKTRLTTIAVALTLSLLSVLEAASQVEAGVAPPVLPVSEALAMLASEGQAGRGATVIMAAFRGDAALADMPIGNRRFYSDADRDALLNGIEEIAIGAGDDARARESFLILRTIGVPLRGVAPEAHQVPATVLRIFNRTGSRSAKSQALHLLGELLAFQPAERAEIEEVLFDAASGNVAGFPAVIGIQVLLSACDAGRPTLRRLYREEIISDPWLDTWLQELAEQDFPIEVMQSFRYLSPCPAGEHP